MLPFTLCAIGYFGQLPIGAVLAIFSGTVLILSLGQPDFDDRLLY